MAVSVYADKCVYKLVCVFMRRRRAQPQKRYDALLPRLGVPSGVPSLQPSLDTADVAMLFTEPDMPQPDAGPSPVQHNLALGFCIGLGLRNGLQIATPGW